jgi:hypothetical protein
MHIFTRTFAMLCVCVGARARVRTHTRFLISLDSILYQFNPQHLFETYFSLRYSLIFSYHLQIS